MTHDRLVFGITIDQIDQLNSLLRTITANGDMVTICSADALHPQSVSTLGGHLQRGSCVRGVFPETGSDSLI